MNRRSMLKSLSGMAACCLMPFGFGKTRPDFKVESVEKSLPYPGDIIDVFVPDRLEQWASYNQMRRVSVCIALEALATITAHGGSVTDKVGDRVASELSRRLAGNTALGTAVCVEWARISSRGVISRSHEYPDYAKDAFTTCLGDHDVPLVQLDQWLYHQIYCNTKWLYAGQSVLRIDGQSGSKQYWIDTPSQRDAAITALKQLNDKHVQAWCRLWEDGIDILHNPADRIA